MDVFRGVTVAGVKMKIVGLPSTSRSVRSIWCARDA